MAAGSNKNLVSARLPKELAAAIHGHLRLPSSSPIRRSLRRRGLKLTREGLMNWLIDPERAAMLIDEVNGGQHADS